LCREALSGFFFDDNDSIGFGHLRIDLFPQFTGKREQADQEGHLCSTFGL
jgi:hypothetical protein